MKTRLGSWVLVATAFFSISALAETSAADLRCKALMAKIGKRGEVVEKKLRAQSSPENTSGFLRRASQKIRDWSFLRLQTLNQEDYPFVGRSEAPLAKAWSKSAFGRLSDEQRALIDLPAIHADLKKTSDAVATYPQRLTKIVDGAANLEMERTALLAKMKSKDFNELSTEPIRIEMPYYKDGVLQETNLVKYYGSPAKVINTAKKGYKDEFARLAGELSALGREQAENTQKLEVYAHEFRGEQSLDPDFDMAKVEADYTNLLTQVDAFYASGAVDGKLKPELLPPFKSWNTWRWKAFFRQVYLISLKQKVKLQGDNTTTHSDGRVTGNGALWDLIGSFSKDDQKSIGMQNFVKDYSFLNIKKWAAVKWDRIAKVTGLGVIAPSTIFGIISGIVQNDEGQSYLKGWAKELWADHNKRNECIKAPTEEAFKKCMAQYLKIRFPEKYLEGAVELDEVVDQGQIKDVKILAIIEDIKTERRAFQATARNSSVVDAALDNTLDDPADPTSDLFRKNLVSTKAEDEGMMVMILTSPVPGTGYLATKYPEAMQFKDVVAVVRVAVESRAEPGEWKAAIRRLREIKMGNVVADELEAFMNDRRDYLNDSTNLDAVDKKIEDAAKLDRGTAK